MNADTPRPKVLVVAGGGLQVGKSWLHHQMVEAARATGCEVVEVGPNHQFGVSGEFLSFDESGPIPSLFGCRIITDDAPLKEKTQPDWKRPKYFGNRRRKR